jgi:hypothetical protein
MSSRSLLKNGDVDFRRSLSLGRRSQSPFFNKPSSQRALFRLIPGRSPSRLASGLDQYEPPAEIGTATCEGALARSPLMRTFLETGKT